MDLLDEPENIDKEELQQEVQKQLAFAQGQDCHTICGAMDDKELVRFIKSVKEILYNKKRKMLIEEQLQYP
jgi:hypothetical protein